MLLQSHFKIDASGISSMIEAGRRFSKRTPAIAVTTTAYVISTFAYAKTPVADINRITTELAVQVTAVVGRRGPLSPHYAKNRRYAANLTPSGGGAHPEVPLSWLLISARAKLSSDYNKSTGGRWAILGGHPLKGHRVAEFAQIMADHITRMVKSRRSTPGFIRAGWIQPLKLLAASGLVSPSALRGRGVRAPTDRQTRGTVSDLGYAVPAQLGSVRATSEIGNGVGTRNQSLPLAAKHNEALWRYGAPALQSAIDDEYLNTMRYVADQEFREQFGRLKSRGLVINV